MDNFILIIGAICIGYVLNWLNVFPKEAPTILNKFVIYISLPAMIMLQIPRLTFSYEVLIPIVIAWTVMILSAIFILFISKILNFSKEITGSLLLVGILGNTSFLGIPILNAYFGESALPYVIVYDQLGTFIALATFGTFVASYYSSKQEVSFKLITLKVLTFPPFLSLIVALLFIGTTFPDTVTSVLSSFANTIVPIALVAVGLQLKLKLPREEIKPFGVALFTKLLLAPALAYLICYMLTWDNEIAKISIMEAGMGPMITAGAVASMAGLSPRLSSAIVGYGIIFSFLTTGVLFRLIT